MPIYEYQCRDCHEIFERLELSAVEIPTSQCTHCGSIGQKIMSRPSLVYELMDLTATHKLPDWNQRQRAAERHDAAVRRNLRVPAPLPGDQGQKIKVYDTEFGPTERRRLEQKAQLDNMP